MTKKTKNTQHRCPISTRNKSIHQRNKWLKETGVEVWRNNPNLSMREAAGILFDKLNDMHPAFHYTDGTGTKSPLRPLAFASVLSGLSELKVREAAFEVPPQPTLPLVVTPHVGPFGKVGQTWGYGLDGKLAWVDNPPGIEASSESAPNMEAKWATIAASAFETTPHEDECIRQEEDTFAAGISKAFLANKRPLLVTEAGRDPYQKNMNSFVLCWCYLGTSKVHAVITLEDIVRDPTEVAAWLVRNGWIPTSFEVRFLQMYILTQILLLWDANLTGWLDERFYNLFENKSPGPLYRLRLRPGSSLTHTSHDIQKG